MINDCAYVGETLIKYLPRNLEVTHLKRSRRILDKTFGIAWKILRVKGDVYHVHYLLQDCYIALKLGKRPIIGHAHGSDLRKSLKHPLWGRIIKHNLKECDKVLVSTPDVLDTAKKLRQDSEYLPNPIDFDLFYAKPLVGCHGKKQVLIASDCNWSVKGTDLVIRALSRIKDKVDVSIIGYGVDLGKTVALASLLGLRLDVLPKISHERLNEYYWNADVVIDRFQLGSLGMVSLEAIACGRPVVAYVSSELQEYDKFPLKDVNTEEEITNTIENADSDLWKKEHSYLTANHSAKLIVKKLLKLYTAYGEGFN